MTLDLGSGSCDKLINRQCSIYDRRPHACKTVPFHYHLADIELERGLNNFLNVDGFECDTSEHADAALRDGRLASERFASERSIAQFTVSQDYAWHNAIARRVWERSDPTGALPLLDDLKAGSCLKVTLVPIYLAWQVGLEVGMIDAPAYQSAIDKQVSLVEALLRRDASSPLLGIDGRSRRQLTDILNAMRQ